MDLYDNTIEIFYPSPDTWEGFKIEHIPVEEILPQADPDALKRLKALDMKDEWTQHLFSLEKYKDEVLATGWHNPISISRATEKDLDAVPSGHAWHEGINYIIGVGYNRHYWSSVWEQETIPSIVWNTWLGSQGVRSLMEVGKKIERHGIERAEGNLRIPNEKFDEYDLFRTRIPQKFLPRFKVDPGRIVEKIKGDFGNLTGKHRVIRPMPGARTHTSKFYQISGAPPVPGEEFVAIFQPEGWIDMSTDYHKYLKMFREWK